MSVLPGSGPALDVGCGTGSLTSTLASKRSDYWVLTYRPACSQLPRGDARAWGTSSFCARAGRGSRPNAATIWCSRPSARRWTMSGRWCGWTPWAPERAASCPWAVPPGTAWPSASGKSWDIQASPWRASIPSSRTASWRRWTVGRRRAASTCTGDRIWRRGTWSAIWWDTSPCSTRWTRKWGRWSPMTCRGDRTAGGSRCGRTARWAFW